MSGWTGCSWLSQHWHARPGQLAASAAPQMRRTPAQGASLTGWAQKCVAWRTIIRGRYTLHYGTRGRKQPAWDDWHPQAFVAAGSSMPALRSTGPCRTICRRLQSQAVHASTNLHACRSYVMQCSLQRRRDLLLDQSRQVRAMRIVLDLQVSSSAGGVEEVPNLLQVYLQRPAHHRHEVPV